MKIVRRVVIGALGALFLMPFAVLLSYSRDWSFHWDSQLLQILWQILWFTIVESFLSALLAMLLGICGALGLLALSSHRPRIQALIQTLCVLPNAVPAIVTGLAVLKSLSSTRGLSAIVTAHVILNAGMVAVVVQKLFLEKLVESQNWR